MKHAEVLRELLEAVYSLRVHSTQSDKIVGLVRDLAKAAYEAGKADGAPEGLRDVFAAAALQGRLAAPTTSGTKEEFARKAWEYSDAMLAERARR